MRVKIGYDYGVIFIIDFMTATVMTAYDSIESTFSNLAVELALLMNCSQKLITDFSIQRAIITLNDDYSDQFVANT